MVNQHANNVSVHVHGALYSVCLKQSAREIERTAYTQTSLLSQQILAYVRYDHNQHLNAFIHDQFTHTSKQSLRYAKCFHYYRKSSYLLCALRICCSSFIIKCTLYLNGLLRFGIYISCHRYTKELTSAFRGFTQHKFINRI